LGEVTDVSVGAGVDRTPGYHRIHVSRSLDFFNHDLFDLRGDDLIRIDVPTDASTSTHRDWLLIKLRTDWEVAGESYRAGSLLATYTPAPTQSKNEPPLRDGARGRSGVLSNSRSARPPGSYRPDARHEYLLLVFIQIARQSGR